MLEPELKPVSLSRKSPNPSHTFCLSDLTYMKLLSTHDPFCCHAQSLSLLLSLQRVQCPYPLLRSTSLYLFHGFFVCLFLIFRLMNLKPSLLTLVECSSVAWGLLACMHMNWWCLNSHVRIQTDPCSKIPARSTGHCLCFDWWFGSKKNCFNLNSTCFLFTQSCPTLCDPMDCPWNSPGQNTGVGSLSFSRGSSQPRDQTHVFHFVGGFFTSWATRETQDCWSG